MSRFKVSNQIINRLKEWVRKAGNMTLVEKAQELVKALLLPLVETEVKKHQAEIDAKVDHIVDLVFAKLEEINPLKFANPIVEAEKPLVKAAVHAELLKLEDQISAKV